MTLKKIVHIHSDFKFVYEIDNYSEEFFNNQLVFIGDLNKLSEPYKKIAITFVGDKRVRIQKLINICESADLVILNNLENLSVNLALLLPKNIKIIWRIFGNEVYTKEPELIYSKTSLCTYKPGVKKLSFLNQVKHHIWHLLHPGEKEKFKLAIKRIDYLLGIMDDEHAFLKKIGYELPPFIQVPLSSISSSEICYEKTDLIIFGNSRNRGNNHLDILNLMKKIDLPPNLLIKMFFSYGSKGGYPNQVKEESKLIKQIEIVEDFLSKEEFDSIYQKATALIFNGYRQMAMGNIFSAIKNGLKVYLSEKNVTYKWMIKNGIKVFSIEKLLEDDLKDGNYFLTKDEIKINVVNLHILIDNCSIEKFNKNLLAILNK